LSIWLAGPDACLATADAWLALMADRLALRPDLLTQKPDSLAFSLGVWLAGPEAWLDSLRGERTGATETNERMKGWTDGGEISLFYRTLSHLRIVAHKRKKTRN